MTAKLITVFGIFTQEEWRGFFSVAWQHAMHTSGGGGGVVGGGGDPLGKVYVQAHREREVSQQIHYLTRSQYTDTGPTIHPDPVSPGAEWTDDKPHHLRPGAGIREADDRQVMTVTTVQPSSHYRHSTNPVSRSVTIVGERAATPHLVVRRRWQSLMILGLSTADGGMTVGL